MRVLVTGASGLIGSETMAALTALGAEAIGVSRRGNDRRPNIVAWDLLDGEPPQALRRRWDAIVHTAANTRWTQSSQEAWRANVDTVAALARLASPKTHVVHVSTAYAPGLRGAVESASLEDYRNTYEWSKAQAERTARDLFERLTIVRPPLTIGRRADGRAARFSGMYVLLRGITSSTVPAIVGDPHAFFDVVPVDDVARLLASLAVEEPSRLGRTLIIAGGVRSLRVEEALRHILASFNGWRAAQALPALEQPPLVAPERWNRFLLPFARNHLTARQLRVLGLLSEFQPYLALTEPLEPTHPVRDVASSIEASVAYWADANARIASMTPRPWKPD